MTLVNELTAQFGLGPRDLSRIIATAPKRYKVYTIPKRRGGMRTIAQPSQELKAIQRYVVEKKLSLLPIHPAATAYASGRNILQNAEAHVMNRVVLKLDFRDFFPSIKVRDWSRFIRTKPSAEPLRPDLSLYSKILFWGKGTTAPNCLSIGAPSSPILSNVLMYDLDIAFSQAAGEAEVSYTRYADDITVSATSVEAVRLFEDRARRIIRSTASPRLEFNDEKRGLYLRGQRRMVTGLILTPTNAVSVGRARKRMISAMLHHVLFNRSDPNSMARLKGWLGFCIANEPSFVSRMRRKYGDAVLDRVLRYEVPSREVREVR